MLSIPLHFVQSLSVCCDALCWEQTERKREKERHTQHTHTHTHTHTSHMNHSKTWLTADPCPQGGSVCVECLIGKQKKPILFKVTEPSSVPYRTPPACANRASYPDPPPVILLPESIAVTVFEMGLCLPWHEPVLAKAIRTVYLRNAVIFQYNSVGGRAASHPNHHCGSQQTLCLVPSLGCPTLVAHRHIQHKAGRRKISAGNLSDVSRFISRTSFNSFALTEVYLLHSLRTFYFWSSPKSKEGCRARRTP